MAGSSYSSHKEITLTREDGTEYVFDLRDLEEHIKQEYSCTLYNCALDIRVNEPEVANAVGPVLVLHDPQITYRGTITCKISQRAWFYLQGEAEKCFTRTLTELTNDNIMIGGCTVGMWLSLFKGLTSPAGSLSRKLGITGALGNSSIPY